jgi:CRISPR-associated RAMP protein (TIGR02581 family)
MHKRRLNELILYAILQPDGPILIKSGTESGADPTLPSMNFVRTRHPENGERTIYLPGSSLKGAIRSHIERIIRTVQQDHRPEICCDPLDARESCGKRIDMLNAERKRQKLDPLNTAEEYQELCLACRIFGHMAHASHFTSSDAYPLVAIDTQTQTEALSVRQGVAINRFSGGVGVGPFEIEVAITGQFQCRLMLTNFELWQVGLLALALRDLAQGRLLLGFGKSRGLGKVDLFLTHMEIAYPGHFASFDPVAHIYGAGALASDLVRPYWLVPNDELALPAGGRLAPDGLTWGRPAVLFGLQSPRLSAADLQETQQVEQIQAAHAQIMSVLAATVPAWAKYKKPEATHA